MNGPGVQERRSADPTPAGAVTGVDEASAASTHAPFLPEFLGSDDARRRVAASILTHGPSTAADLAERLEVTPTAVRRQLAALEEVGHVTSRAQRVYGARGRGRPARVFLLTDAGRAEFASTYDDLAIDALDYLARRLGPGAVADFASEAMRPLEQAFEQAEGADAGERLVEALNQRGFVAALAPAPAGRQLCQQHCPIAHVARAYPELCIAETKIISRLLGTHVQRLATIAHGDEVCTTHIPTPLDRDAAEHLHRGPRPDHQPEGNRS